MKKFFLFAVSLLLAFTATASLRPERAPKALPTLSSTELAAPSTMRTRIVPATEPAMAKAPAASLDASVLTVDYVQCVYLGSYYEAMGSAIEAWSYQFYNGDNFVAEIGVVGTDGKHIVGNWSFTASSTDAYALVVAAASDTADVYGTFDCTYDAATATYSFALAATDASNRSFTLSFQEAKDSIPAIDYYVYMLNQYGVSSSSPIITLKDGPQVTGQTYELTFPGYTAITWYGDYGVYFIDAYDESDEEELWVAFEPVTAGTPVGEYHGADCIWEGEAGVYYNGEELAADSVDMSITVVADTTVVDLTVHAGGNAYHAVLKNYTITPTSVVTLTFAPEQIEFDAMDTEAVFYAESDEYYLQFLYLVSTADQFAGSFTEEDLVGQYSGIGDIAANAVYQVLQAQFTVAQNGNAYTLTGSFICNNEVQYNTTLTASLQALEQIFGAESEAVKVIRDGQVVIVRNGAVYTLSGAQLQ